MVGWVLPVIGGVEKVMETVAFIQFIEEEAIQACMLGAYLGMKARNYQATNLALTTTENQLLPHLTWINDNLGWLSPYSKGVFADYITATETQLEVYKELLSAGLK